MVTISGKTRLCAVIGSPIEHSLSPAIHNASFEATGLDYAYVAFQADDLGGAITGVRALKNLVGLSVTIPHKVSIIPHLDDLDALAVATGSVNTVVRRGDRLFGYTTDGPAVVRALGEQGITNIRREVLILGSGGAARAISFALANKMEVGGITILGVVNEEIDTLVNDLSTKTAVSVKGDLLNNQKLKEIIPECDLVVHCTPIGMYPKVDETLLTSELLSSQPVVFDIVYNPLQTNLLKEASSAGCKVIPGIQMFINQAAMQFELWTGRPAPLDVMRKVVKDNL